MEKFEILHVKNPFDRSHDEKSAHPYTGAPLLEYIDTDGHLVTVEGKILTSWEAAVYVPKKDEIVIVRPLLQKSVFKTIALLAVAVVGTLITSGILLSGLSIFWGAIIGAAVSIGGSLLINAIIPPPSPTKQQETPTYGWSGAQLTARQGIPIAKGWGTFQEAGNVIASYVTTESNKQYQHLLIALGHGPAKSISNILINDNPLENYKGIWVEKRLGYIDQSVIPFFNDVIDDYAQNVKVSVSGGAVTISGKSSNTEAVEVGVVFPKGLYRTDDKGKLKNLAVGWKLEVALNGGAFTEVLTPRTTANVNQTDHWVAIANDQLLGAPTGMTFVYATSANPTDHYEGEPYDQTVTVNYYDEFSTVYSRSQRNQGTWTKNPMNSATGGQSGSTLVIPQTWTTVSKFTSAASSQPQRDTLRIDKLTKGKYDVRITKIGYVDDASHVSFTSNSLTRADKDQNGASDEMWLESVKEIEYRSLTHPGLILLGIRALATEQLNGQTMNVTALVDHGTPETAGYKHMVAADRPTIFYRFDETGGTTVLDASGLGYNGTYNGTVNKNLRGLIKNSPSLAIRPNYDNNISYVSIDTPPTIPAANWSFECWLKTNASAGGVGADGFLMESVTGTTYAYVRNDAAGTNLRKINVSIVGGTSYFSTAALALDTLYHIAIIVNGTNLKIIINGVLDSSQTITLPTGTFQPKKVARNFYGARFDEWAFYNYSVRPMRFKQHYTTGRSKHNVLEPFLGNNPAIVGWDALTNDVYGAGQDYSSVNEQKFLELANRSNEVVSNGRGGQIFRYEINGIADAQTNVWDFLNTKLGPSCGSTFIQVGTSISVVVDKPGNVDQIFGMGNILRGSLKESWLGQTDRANSLDLFYSDELNGYKRQPIIVEKTEVIQAGQEIRKAGQMDLWGVTSEARAWLLGRYHLLSNDYQRMSVEFVTSIDGLGATLGSVIALAHDVPKYSISGRIRKRNSSTSFRLDQPVTMVGGGVTYSLVTRHDKVQRATGTINNISDNIVTLNGYTLDTTVKRFVVGAIDLKVVSTGTGYVEVEDTTGLSNGQTYFLYDTDVIETIPVTTVVGTSDTITVSTPFSTTVNGIEDDETIPNIYFFISSVNTYKKFRITNISRHQDLNVRIRAIEYNAQFYTDLDTDPLITPTRSAYAVYGPLNAQSSTNNAGTGTRAWSNVGNILLSDNVYATAQNSAAGTTETSNFLFAQNPDPKILPADTIVGIVVDVECAAVVAAGGSVTDATVKLLKNGVVVGSNRANGAWSATEGHRTYGGTKDLWDVHLGAELLANGGGETGTVGVQAPSWTLGNASGLLVANDFVKSGAKSLKITNASATDSFSYQDITVTQGKVYRLSGWIKTTALNTADSGWGAVLNLDVISGSIAVVSRVGSTPFGTASGSNPWDVGIAACDAAVDWTYVEVVFKCTVGGTLRLYAQLGHAGGIVGSAWFDNVSIVPYQELTVADANAADWGVAISVSMVTAGGQPVTVARVDNVRFTFYTSKAANAQVKSLTGTETAVMVDGTWQNRFVLNWINGQNTYGADVYASINNGPEVFLGRVYGNPQFSYDVKAGDAAIFRVVGFDIQGFYAPYQSAPTFTALVLGNSTNLIKNSTFKAAYALWEPAGVSGPGLPGLRAADVYAYDGVTDGGHAFFTTGSSASATLGWMTQPILGMIASTPYTVSGYVWVPSGCAGSLCIEILDEGGGTIARAHLKLSTAITNQWVRISATATTPGSFNPVLRVFIDSTDEAVSIPSGKTFKVQKIQVEVGSSATSWVDDDYVTALQALTGTSSISLTGQASVISATINSGFASSTTTTSIQVSWVQLLIQFAANRKIRVPAGSLTASSLSAGTTYYFYIYYNITNLRMTFVTGTTGSPAIAFTSRSDAAVAEQTADGHIQISNGALQIATPSTGTGGGSGFGGSECPEWRQIVHHKERGDVEIRTCVVGDVISNGRGGWTTIQRITFVDCDEFIEIETDYGRVVQSPETRMKLADGSDTRVSNMKVYDVVEVPGGSYAVVNSVRRLRINSKKAVITCAEDHEFACGDIAPSHIVHNIISSK